MSGEKRRAWNPEREQYVEFRCDRMMEHPDNTDLVWDKDGNYKRKLMKDYDRCKTAHCKVQNPPHYKNSHVFHTYLRQS